MASRPPGDWALAAEACVRLAGAYAALRLLPFAWVTASLSAGGRDDADTRQVERIAWAVEAAAKRLPLKVTCLRRAFAAAWMLQARGLSPRLHYGVAKAQDGGFESHAWVEIGDQPVVGHRAAGGFTLLATFPEEKTS